MVRLRQISGAIKDEHRTRFLELGDCFASALHKQYVTGTQANHVQITCHLRTRSARPMQGQRQQAITVGKTCGSKTTQVQRRTAGDDNLGQLLALGF